MSVNELSTTQERPPFIRFERRGVEDKQASLKEGHYVAKDVDFALINAPFDKDTIHIKVESWLRNEEQNVKNGRTPAEWLERWKKGYEAWKEGEEMQPDGTPIKGWGVLSPAQEKMILRAGIRTIEDLAACNDQGLRQLGLGARDLINKAKAWLNSVNDHGKVAMQNAALEKENEQLKVTLESLEEKVAILAKQVQSQSREDDEAPQVETITAADILDDPEPEEVLSLTQQYENKFGKKPHWKMKEETIRAKLEE